MRACVEVCYCEPDGRERHFQLSARRLRPQRRRSAGAGGARRLRARGDGERPQGEGPHGGARHARCRRRARGQHPDHRHLQLRPDAARRDAEIDPRYELLRKVEKQTFRAAQHRQRPARVRPRPQAGAPAAAAGGGRAGRPRGARRSAAAGAHRVALAATRRRADGARRRPGAAAGVRQPLCNALDAMGERGGRLELTVESDGDRAVAAVCDTGPGIPRAEQERIFHPFYSTKLARAAPASGSPSATRSCAGTAATCGWKASRDAAAASSSSCHCGRRRHRRALA